jgi:hypothetical protein
MKGKGQYVGAISVSIGDHRDVTFAGDVCERVCKWEVGMRHDDVVKAGSGQHNACCCHSSIEAWCLAMDDICTKCSSPVRHIGV